MKSAFFFRVLIGSLFITQYFVGYDGHGSRAHYLPTLLFGIGFIVYGLVTLGQYVVAVRRIRRGIPWKGIVSRWSPTGIFLIFVGVLWGAQYFVGFGQHGRDTGNIMSLLFGGVFIAWGTTIIAKRGSSKTNRASQCRRGTMYERGEGVKQDYAEALNWYRKSADQGFSIAQFNLARLFVKGQGVKQDYAEALSWFRKAADQGNVQAQFNVGLLYSKGLGTDKNYAEALKYYNLAAKKEFPPALNGLGHLYQHGLGVPQDYAKAMELYQKASDRGWCDAFVGLGDLYANGHGVNMDVSEAHFWYSLAASISSNEVAKKYSLEQVSQLEHRLTSAQIEKNKQRVEDERPRRAHLSSLVQSWN